MAKVRESRGQRFDTEPNAVTGQSLHVRPAGGRLHVGITYPVSIGGQIQIRELSVMLDAGDRAALAEFLGR